MTLFDFTTDASYRTNLFAPGAANTLVCNIVFHQAATTACRAFFVNDMAFIFISKVSKGADNWIGSCLSQAA